MKTETFTDGSTIETDELTGNRTVCGKLAHDEYFKRLRAERITRETSPAVIAFCQNMDGRRKAELIRRNTHPNLIDTFGQYVWEVWSDADPENVQRCRDEESARKYFNAAMLHGTNGFGV